MREVEAEYRVADVEALLLALKARGIELAPAVVQDDQAYGPGGLAVRAVASGRVTLRDFARALALDTWAAHDLLRAEGVEINQGNRAETTPALDVVTRAALATGHDPDRS